MIFYLNQALEILRKAGWTDDTILTVKLLDQLLVKAQELQDEDEILANSYPPENYTEDY